VDTFKIIFPVLIISHINGKCKDSLHAYTAYMNIAF